MKRAASDDAASQSPTLGVDDAVGVGHQQGLASVDGFLTGGGHVLQEHSANSAGLPVAMDPPMELEDAPEPHWSVKKRRRRTRQYAGFPADPPGPPRFPSETTLSESTKVLALDKVTYAAVRDEFRSICEAVGITRKSLAGQEVWDRAKSDLVAAFPVLEEDLWGGNDPVVLDKRKLALDVICTDVTKRMRADAYATATDKILAMTEAKNILELNPTESREVRAAFTNILKREGLASKAALGAERWTALKQKWIDESDHLRKTLTKLGDANNYEMKTRAVEVIATDVMKRLRDENSKKKSDKDKGKPPVAAIDSADFDDGDVGLGDLSQDTSGFAAAMLVPTAQQPHGHGPQRMMSGHIVGAQMDMQLPMDSQLDASLLLDPNGQNAFMNAHSPFIPEPQSMASGPSPFDTPQAQAEAAAYQMSQANNNIVPIYLREVGPDGSLGEIWIACLTSPTPSLAELRHVAAQKMPGSSCVEVTGMVKVPNAMGGSQYFPLQILDDDQLGAHLAQDGPEFHVRLSF